MEFRDSGTNMTQANKEVDFTPESGDAQRRNQPLNGDVTALAKALGETLTRRQLTAREAANRIGVGRSQFYQMHSSGQLGPQPVRYGKKCIRWRADEIDAWLAAGSPSREKWLAMLEEQAQKN